MNTCTGIRAGVTLVVLLVLASCDTLVGSGTSGNSSSSDSSIGQGLWTWLSGSNIPGRSGVYGTQGVATSGNVPGARTGATSWNDNDGNFWLFGGFGRGADGSLGDLNDLWRFDGRNWIWVSGNFGPGDSGAYGTRGVASAANNPPARRGGASWIDRDGNLWLFGGSRFSVNGPVRFNDLWRFDGADWTWISGDDGINQAGIYGEVGIPAIVNVPGARESAVAWVDSGGHFWLFGGAGFDSAGTAGDLNDLWRFDGLNWTWVSGDNSANVSGEYPVEGPSLVERPPGPGGRNGAAGWIDGNDNLWVFGGLGRDGDGTRGRLNDLWYFDGSDWFWVSGADTVDQIGEYGTVGVGGPDNEPGSRSAVAHWTDDSNRFWLFGGFGFDSVGADGQLNDLWYFNGSVWTWVSGADTVHRPGVYGEQGVPISGNVPGARDGAAAWMSRDGDLWLFGGRTASNLGNNDLWRFRK